MSKKKYKPKMHFCIRKKDGVSDYTACDTARSYLEKATDNYNEVNCAACIRIVNRG